MHLVSISKVEAVKENSWNLVQTKQKVSRISLGQTVSFHLSKRFTELSGQSGQRFVTYLPNLYCFRSCCCWFNKINLSLILTYVVWNLALSALFRRFFYDVRKICWFLSHKLVREIRIYKGKFDRSRYDLLSPLSVFVSIDKSGILYRSPSKIVASQL